MAVVVFDSDVLIGFLNRDDAHHVGAVEHVQAAMAPGNQRLLCAVNLAEIMIGPIRAGTQEVVGQMLDQFGIATIPVGGELASRAAAVRARTNLKLPDAFAVATAIDAQHHSPEDVQLASFDAAVRRAFGELRVS